MTELSGCLGSAAGEGVECSVEDTVDPIRKRLSIKFVDPIPNGSWNPLQILVHGFSMANDCMIQKMWKANHKKVEADLLIKRRGGPEKNNNPLAERWQSERERREFEKRLRDKLRTFRRSLP